MMKGATKIINEKYVCVRHKNRRKYNEHFKLLFLTINLHLDASDQVSTYRKLNVSLASSIHLVFLPLEMQRRLKQTNVCHTLFYFVIKETTHKSIEVPAVKTIFSSVDLIDKTYFEDCFLLHVITRRH